MLHTIMTSLVIRLVLPSNRAARGQQVYTGLATTMYKHEIQAGLTFILKHFLFHIKRFFQTNQAHIMYKC